MDYAKKMDVILRLLGIRTRDPMTDNDPRVKKSASDYPGFMSLHGKMVGNDMYFAFWYVMYLKDLIPFFKLSKIAAFAEETLIEVMNSVLIFILFI